MLLIEADFEMPVFSYIFPEIRPDVFINDYLSQSKHSLEHYIYPNTSENLGIVFCSPQYRPGDKVFSLDPKWYQELHKKMTADLPRLDYDYVIFDMAPGQNIFNALVYVLSDVIYLILRPDSYSVEGAKLLLDTFYSTAGISKNKEFNIIFNQVPRKHEVQGLLDKWRNQLLANHPSAQFSTIEFSDDTALDVASSNFLLSPSDTTFDRVYSITERLLD